MGSPTDQQYKYQRGNIGGGMDGMASSTTVTSPYQQKQWGNFLSNAENLFNKGLPEYYTGPTVAGFTPAQLESMNLTSNWVTGGAQDMMGKMNQNYMDMMSGRVNTGEGSPYGDMMKVFQNQAMDSANDVMGQLRGNQVMSGQYGGSSRGDLMNNQVIDAANKYVQDKSAEMYMNAYDQAQNTRNNALMNYSSIMNMPVEMSTALYNKVGLPQQQLNQAMMDEQRAKYEYDAWAPYQNMAIMQGWLNNQMGGTTQAYYPKI